MNVKSLEKSFEENHFDAVFWGSNGIRMIGIWFRLEGVVEGRVTNFRHGKVEPWNSKTYEFTPSDTVSFVPAGSAAKCNTIETGRCHFFYKDQNGKTKAVWSSIKLDNEKELQKIYPENLLQAN